MRRAALLALGVVMTAAAASGQSFTLDFNAPVPGTLTDTNGLGTGFTTRLPGTGTALPLVDPNIVLSCGSLFVTSSNPSSPTNTSFFPTSPSCPSCAGPSFVEALCVPWSAGPSLVASTIVRNVLLPNQSNQLGIVVGTSATQLVRAFVNHNNAFGDQFFVFDQGVTGSSTSGGSVFSPGDDLKIDIFCGAGTCSAALSNLTSGGSATLGPVSVPWLTSAASFFVGVFNVQESYNLAAFTAQFDEFTIGAPISTGNGQSNSSTARLEINGVGAGTQPGPFVVCTAPLQPLTFAWQGAPLMPMILINGPLRPTPYAVPGIGGLPGLGLVHLGFSPTFSDITIIFDGAHMPGGLQLTTSPTGTASQTVIVPAGTPPGTQIAVQGIVEQVAGTTTYGNLMTAAFRIDVQ